MSSAKMSSKRKSSPGRSNTASRTKSSQKKLKSTEVILPLPQQLLLKQLKRESIELRNAELLFRHRANIVEEAIDLLRRKSNG